MEERIERLAEEIQDLREDNERLRDMLNESFVENFQSIFDGFKGVTDSDIDKSIDTSGSSTNVLDYPDDLVRIRMDGKIGRIPFYNESRF